MLKSFTYFLLFAFAAPNALQLSRLFDFFNHHKEYVQLCENKENEELKCNGLCKLTQELKHEEPEHPEKPNIPSETLSFLLIAILPHPENQKNHLSNYKQKQNSFYSLIYYNPELSQLERPPQFSV